jgi:phosphoribosyl-ATP pyrophosphohydrolase/phosphoribosyl-AMP cyclohydrolase
MTTNNLEFLSTLDAVIADRLSNPSSESYTASLAALGPKRIAQKVGEEGVELALASLAGSRTEIIDEASDLFYHVLVLLRYHDVGIGDIVKTLQARHTG